MVLGTRIFKAELRYCSRVMVFALVEGLCSTLSALADKNLIQRHR